MLGTLNEITKLEFSLNLILFAKTQTGFYSTALMKMLSNTAGLSPD